MLVKGGCLIPLKAKFECTMLLVISAFVGIPKSLFLPVNNEQFFTEG